MRTVFWLTAFTLVAASVTTIAVADYVYRHPNSMLGRCVTRLVHGEDAVGGSPASGCHDQAPCVVPSADELARLSGLADEPRQVAQFPEPIEFPPIEQPDSLDGVVVSLNHSGLTSDLDIPIRNSSFNTGPATPVSEERVHDLRNEYGNRSFPPKASTPVICTTIDPDERVKGGGIQVIDVNDPDSLLDVALGLPGEVLTVMPKLVEDDLELLPAPRPVADDRPLERVGVDFNVGCPKVTRTMTTKNGVISIELRLQAGNDGDDCECPFAWCCQSLGHCLFGWMVGMDCYDACRYAGVKCSGKACHEGEPEMCVNGVCSKSPRVKAVERPECFDQRVNVDYRNKPLCEVMDDLRELTGLNIVADRPALEQAGVSLDRCVHIRLKEVKLEKALQLVLHDAHCCYTLEDGILIVTTPCQAKGKLSQCVYPVADLVAGMDGNNRVELLLKLIRDGVEPASWDCVGGPGHLDYFPLGMSLVVNQTEDVHEQLQVMLDRLRALAIPQGNVACVKVLQQSCPMPSFPCGDGGMVLPRPVDKNVQPAAWNWMGQTKQVEFVPLQAGFVEQLLAGLHRLEEQRNQGVEQAVAVPCPVPCEPCVEDDFIELEADEVELHFGALKVRCKGFRMSAPSKAVGMLKGCAADPGCPEGCCPYPCCTAAEEDLVAEFMKYEPNGEEDFNHWLPAVTDEDASAFRNLLRRIEAAPILLEEPPTPEKLPVCDHDRTCPAAGKLSLPLEEEVIQADFEIAVEPKDEKTPEITIEFVPGIYIDGSRAYRIERDGFKAVEPTPKKVAPKRNGDQPPKPEANSQWEFPVGLVWCSGTPVRRSSCETERDALVLLTLDWLNDLRILPCSESLRVPDWAKEMTASSPVEDRNGDWGEIHHFWFASRLWFGAFPAGVETVDESAQALPKSLCVPDWVKEVIRPPMESEGGLGKTFAF